MRSSLPVRYRHQTTIEREGCMRLAILAWCAAIIMTFTSTANATLITIDSINESAIPMQPHGMQRKWAGFTHPLFLTPSQALRPSLALYWTSGRLRSSFMMRFWLRRNHFRSADFTPLSNTFSGSQFSPLNVQAHQTYFFGFRNVGGMFTNVTST